MKTPTIALLSAVFLLALGAMTLTDFTRDVGILGRRMDRSEDRVLEARREIASLRRESREKIQELEAGLAGRVELRRAEIERIAREEADALRRALARDVEALYRDVLFPSVQVSARGGVGGGTVLSSRPGLTYVVTAFHVIRKAVVRTGGAETREPVEVRMYDEAGAPLETLPGELTAYDDKKDLALIRVRADRTFPNVARLAARETLRGVRVFTPVYAVGCPLGHDPLPTIGEVAALHKDVSGERFWMMSAPTTFGNSGGGIFHRETRELIGVSVMVCTYDGPVSTPVPHLGIMVSLEVVYDWLDSLDCRFVYDPRSPAGQ